MKKNIAIVLCTMVSIAAATGLVHHGAHQKPARAKAVTPDQAVYAWASQKVASKGGRVLANGCRPAPDGTAGRYACTIALAGGGAEACVGVVADVSGPDVRQVSGTALPASYCAGAPGWK